jgi:hypothetical protein
LIRTDIARIETKIDGSFAELSHKVGTMPQTLVALQRDLGGIKRDVASLKDTVGTLGIAVDEHTRRLDHLEHWLDDRHPPV